MLRICEYPTYSHWIYNSMSYRHFIRLHLTDLLCFNYMQVLNPVATSELTLSSESKSERTDRTFIRRVYSLHTRRLELHSTRSISSYRSTPSFLHENIKFTPQPLVLRILFNFFLTSTLFLKNKISPYCILILWKTLNYFYKIQKTSFKKNLETHIYYG